MYFGRVISESENYRLNQEYWAWVSWCKNGTVAMNNHGAEWGVEPPRLILGPTSHHASIHYKCTLSANQYH
jgi:hypothetical protein